MKISIITATWNSGATVRSTMESVLLQNYSDFEHIIVDGGSKDNTLEIVRELEPKYKGKLRYISERDKGIYDAMNKGINLSKGDVIGILNSDDFYTSKDVLSTIANEIKGSDLDAVYGDIHFVNSEDLEKCVRYYSSRFFRRCWMRFGFMPAHPSFYCRKLIYERYGGFDLSFKVASDFENLLRLIYVNRIRTKYIQKDFVTMRTGGVSTSGMSSHKQIMQDHQLAFKKNGIYSNVLFELLRYPFKIAELLYSKIIRNY